jgi:acyl carrier protein
MDHQIKLRGFRIELGEIETALVSHRDVREAIVVAQESQTGDKRLVAYVVPGQEHLAALQKPSDAQSTLAENLRKHLLAKLPEYMVPSTFVLLDRMPLLSNGKVDRKALPRPTQSRDELEQGYVAPRNEVEQTLAEILAEVLGVARVGVHDDFFRLGGHSLLATKAMSRILEKFQIELSAQHLFEQPTVARLAENVLNSEGFRPEALTPITRLDQSPDELLLAKIDQLTDEEVKILLRKFDGQVREEE